MSLVIYNTKNQRKEQLRPLSEGEVRMYVCGITAYDYCHIGHARSALAFDMIYRYLLSRGYRVIYVRNFTDIDDKIINRAREQNTASEELAARFIQAFHEDMAALGVAEPTIEPRATEHVPEIIRMIEELVEKGLAYEAEGDVYYAVEGFAAYGKLSGRSLEEMQAGARVEISEKKRNPMDFALWKASKEGEPAWESPWGAGRPGWHIECSAMSRKYLGDSFDIHGGGKDLIFPHHENEIAQSRGVSGGPFVNIWIHHGFVTIKDEKMSKSLGNFLTIREVLSRHSAEVLRLFVFSTHYRSPLNYSETAMQDAAAGLERLYGCLAEVAGLPATGDPRATPRAPKKAVRKLSTLIDRYRQAMDNDFNTAQALGHIFDAVKGINKILPLLPPEPSADDLELLRGTAAAIRELAGVMGLLGEDPVAYIEKVQEERLRKAGIDREEIEALVRERAAARARKDWARSDEIRDRLLAWKVELKDGAGGTTWQIRGQ